MKEVNLESGSVLKILDTPFAESKALYQAVLEEGKGLNIPSDGNVGQMLKDFFCIGFSSKKIDAALSVCLKRCLYNDLKIDDKTFEPIAARQDYTKICMSVIEENITPFTKGLSVELNRVSAMLGSIQT